MGAQASADRQRNQKIANDQYQSDVINKELDELFQEVPEIDHTDYDNSVEVTNIQIQQDLANQEAEHRQKYAEILAVQTVDQDRRFNNFNQVINNTADVVHTPFNIAADTVTTIEGSLSSLGTDFADNLPYIIGGIAAIGVGYYFITQDK